MDKYLVMEITTGDFAQDNEVYEIYNSYEEALKRFESLKEDFMSWGVSKKWVVKDTPTEYRVSEYSQEWGSFGTNELIIKIIEIKGE